MARSNVFNFKLLYNIYFITAPLIYSTKIIDPTLAPRQIHLALFCGISLLMFFSREKGLPKNNYLRLEKYFHISLIGLLLISIISLTKSTVISEGLFTVSRLSLSLVFFLITSILLNENKLTLIDLCKSILYFALITSIISIYQIITHHNYLIEITGTMANKNLLSSALFLCIPFLLISNSDSKFYKVITYSLVGLILLIITYIRTRAVIIPLICFGLIILGYIIFNLYKAQKKTTIILFTIILICGFIFTNYSFKSNIIENFTNSNTYQTRLKMWENTNSIIKNNLLFGVGAGNWKIEFANYGIADFEKSVRDGRMIYTRPHNDFLWVFSETGILGLITYSCIFIIPCYYLLKLLSKAKSGKEKFNYVILLSSVIGFAFVSFFDFPFERVEHQILFFTLISIIVFLFQSNYINESQKKTSKMFTFSNSKIVICLGIIGEKKTRKIYKAHENQNWPELINLVDNTKNSFYQLDPMSVPIDWYKGVALFATGDMKNSNLIFLEALEQSPYNIHILNNLASSYEKMGNHELAIKYYKEVLRISPNFEEATLNLSAVYFNIKEFEKAFEEIQKCEITSNDPKYRVFLLPILRKKIQNEAKKKNINTLKLDLLSNEVIEDLYFKYNENNYIFVDSCLKIIQK
jgi:O-antigen ligase